MNKKISRKFIITCWAALNFTGFGLLALIKNYSATWLPGSMVALVSIVTVWMGVQGKADWNKDK